MNWLEQLGRFSEVWKGLLGTLLCTMAHSSMFRRMRMKYFSYKNLEGIWRLSSSPLFCVPLGISAFRSGAVWIRFAVIFTNSVSENNSYYMASDLWRIIRHTRAHTGKHTFVSVRTVFGVSVTTAQGEIQHRRGKLERWMHALRLAPPLPRLAATIHVALGVFVHATRSSN